MSIPLKDAEDLLKDTTSTLPLQRYYTIILDKFEIIRNSLVTMRKEKGNKNEILAILDIEISERLREINEWLDTSTASCVRGNLKQYKATEDFQMLNRKLTVEIQSIFNMILDERTDSFSRLRSQLEDLENRIEEFIELTLNMPDNLETIILEKNGSVVSQPDRLKKIRALPWTGEERADNLPQIPNRRYMTMESEIFSFQSDDGKTQQINSLDKTGIIIKIRVRDASIIEGITWMAMSRVASEWTKIGVQIQDGFAVFPVKCIESFFILSTPKEIEFIVTPSGCSYTHKEDPRVQVRFPENAVQENQTIKLQVFPIKKEEMRVKRQLFPSQYQILSISKAIHVEGNLNTAIQLSLPLEHIEEPERPRTHDVEFISFHINGDKVEIERDVKVTEHGDTVSATVKSFSERGFASFRRGSVGSQANMECLIALGFRYHCKLLTFFNKTNEMVVKVWCELVRVEDNTKTVQERLNSDLCLEVVDVISKDIFIREDERIRVEFRGNAIVNKNHVKGTSLLINFIPVATHNHIFVPLEKHAVQGTAPYTTITYSSERFRRESLHMASFDPWSKKYTTMKRANSVPNANKAPSLATPKQQNTKITGRDTPNGKSNPPSAKISSSGLSDIEKSSDYLENTLNDGTKSALKRSFDNFFKDNNIEHLKKKFEDEGFDRVEALLEVTENDLATLNFKLGDKKAFEVAKKKFQQRK